MDAKSQFLGTATDSNDFLTRSLSAISQDTRGGVSKEFAAEVGYIKSHSPNPERADAWAKKVSGTTPDKPKPQARHNLGGMKG